MRVVALVQARDTSTRFPRKIRERIGSFSMVETVVLAAQRVRGVSAAFMLHPDDYPGIPEDDVLGRYAVGAWRHQADAVMRLTADCPLFDPQVGSLVLREFLLGSAARGCEYVSNVWPYRTWPDGMDCEVFTADILRRAAKEATRPDDREHVTPWIRAHAKSPHNVTLPVDWSHVRLTVDTPEDLAWVRAALASPRS